MPHLDPERLTLIALGDLDGDPDEAAHLTECADCGDELAALRQVAAVGAQTQHLRQLPPPPPRVWERIQAELGGSGPAGDPAAAPRALAGNGAGRLPSRWWRLPERARLAVAAGLAAVIAAGAVVAAGQLFGQDPGGTESAVTAQAELVPEPSAPASVAGLARVLDGDTLHMHVTGLPGQAGYYEVWLIDPDTGQLLSVGLLNQRADVLLPLPANVDLQAFRLVDVSAESYDGDAGHSGDSILRGELAGS